MEGYQDVTQDAVPEAVGERRAAMDRLRELWLSAGDAIRSGDRRRADFHLTEAEIALGTYRKGEVI